MGLLTANLPSVFAALQHAAVDYEVIVVDDCSTDDSIAFLQKEFPAIILLVNEKNKGFSPTINRGIMAATKDLVFALNSDVVLFPNYFEQQFHYFEKESTFGVMGRIIGLHDDVIQDAAKYPMSSWLRVRGTVNYLPTQATAEWLPTLFLSGANALIDRKKVQALGGFDEIYAPFYSEDLDLGIRAWRLGWCCWYEDKSVCRHPVSATIRAYHKRNEIKIVAKRNQFIMHSIHYDGFLLLLFKLTLWFNWLIKWQSKDVTFYPAYAQYIAYKAKIRKARKALDKLFDTYQHHSLPAVITKINQLLPKQAVKRW